ncbi:MAG: ABC transporter ATP-binding protein [Nitrospira sp.]|nr:ABC transporter ATP-binding protein [Nitrospira sp.]
MAEVRLEHLSKRYGATNVLPDVTLTINEGELFAVVGPSGCGKSTLLNLLAGLDRPTAGRILFDGEDVTELEPRARDIALVFQSYALYPHMTVRGNLAFPLQVTKRRHGFDRRRIEEEVQKVAGFLGLIPLLDRRPRELSGGQRQRVALGRALIRKPRVFLMDEPLSNLDAKLRASMRAELRRLHEELKITTIYVTHDQTEAMTLADRLAVFNHGEVQQIDHPHEIYARPANMFVAGFMGYPPMNLLDAHREGQTLRAGPIRLPLAETGAQHLLDQPLIMGIRPEVVAITSVAATGEGAVSGIVRLVEPSGAGMWVTVDLQDAQAMTVIGLTEAGFIPNVGDSVAVSVRRASIHLFERATGKRIGSA